MDIGGVTRLVIDAAPVAPPVDVPMPATLEDCYEVIAALVAQLAAQAAQFLQMEIRLADLQKRLKLDSRHTSSKGNHRAVASLRHMPM